MINQADLDPSSHRLPHCVLLPFFFGSYSLSSLLYLFPFFSSVLLVRYGNDHANKEVVTALVQMQDELNENARPWYGTVGIIAK